MIIHLSEIFVNIYFAVIIVIMLTNRKGIGYNSIKITIITIISMRLREGMSEGVEVVSPLKPGNREQMASHLFSWR